MRVAQHANQTNPSGALESRHTSSFDRARGSFFSFRSRDKRSERIVEVSTIGGRLIELMLITRWPVAHASTVRLEQDGRPRADKARWLAEPGFETGRFYRVQDWLLEPSSAATSAIDIHDFMQMHFVGVADLAVEHAASFLRG